MDGGHLLNQEVQRIIQQEVRAALKSGKAVGPNDIPLEIWRCVGDGVMGFLTR